VNVGVFRPNAQIFKLFLLSKRLMILDSDKDDQVLVVNRPKICSQIQNGGRSPFWKTLSAISLQPFDRFWWDLVWWCILALSTWWETKKSKKKIKIQDGRWRPSSKSKNRDISEIVWPILTKFCTMAHISPPELTSIRWGSWFLESLTVQWPWCVLRWLAIRRNPVN